MVAPKEPNFWDLMRRQMTGLPYGQGLNQPMPGDPLPLGLTIPQSPMTLPDPTLKLPVALGPIDAALAAGEGGPVREGMQLPPAPGAMPHERAGTQHMVETPDISPAALPGDPELDYLRAQKQPPPPAPSGVVSPGKWSPFSRTQQEQVTTGAPLQTDVLEKKQQLAQDRVDAGEIGALAEGVEGAQKRVVALEGVSDLTERMREAGERQQKMDEFVAGERQRMAELEQKRDAMKEDPDRIWRGGAGTVKKIAATLGMALGAAGAALSGTKNFAAEIVNNAIRRDIEAQRADMAKVGRQIKGKKENLQYSLQERGSIGERARQSIMFHGKAVELKLQAIGEGSRDAKAKAKWLALAAQVRDGYQNFYHQEVVRAAGKKTMTKSGTDKWSAPVIASKLYRRGGGKMDKSVAKKLGETYEVLSNARAGGERALEILDGIKGTFPTSLKDLPGAQGQDLSIAIRMMAPIQRALAGDVGRISDRDMEVFDVIKAGRLMPRDAIIRRIKGLLHAVDQGEINAYKRARATQAAMMGDDTFFERRTLAAQQRIAAHKAKRSAMGKKPSRY